MNTIKKFVFLDTINQLISKNILKIKNISVINLINPYEKNKQTNINNFFKIIQFCKNNNVPFFITDNYKLAVKTKANGIYLNSFNKTNSHKSFGNEIDIIGVAHNQLEYYFKIRQNCKLIFLSPIFFTKKYSTNKTLGTLRFNLISKNWKAKLGCLGGLTLQNLKKTKLTKINALGFRSLIYAEDIKKPVYFLR